VGGAIRMRNHRHLHPHLIRREIERMRQLVRQRSVRPSTPGARRPGPVGLREIALLSVSIDLDRATQYLDSHGGRPSYRLVYHAYDFLSRARDGFGEAMALVFR
jgi:hypothetical protein